MADQKISALTELTVAPDPTDEFVVVDKSDTAMAASGTDKRIRAGTLTGQVTGGTADDTTAFQAALTAGGTVRLRPGVTYTLTSMTLSSNTTIEGNGATVIRKSGATGDIFTNTVATTNIKVQDVTFDNAHVATGNRMFKFIGGSSNVTIQRCSFINHDFATFAVPNNSTQSTNFKFLDNTIIGGSGTSNRGSIELYDMTWVWFERNYCENHVGFKNESSSAAPGVMHHIFCRDNLFRNIDAMCIELRNNGDGTIEDVVISGNQAYNIGATVTGGKGLSYVGEQVGDAGVASYTRRVSITGNIVKDFRGNGVGIGGGVGSGANGAHPEEIVIANNIFDATEQDLSPQSATGGTGITLTDTWKFSITGNKIQGTGGAGIWVVQNTSKKSSEGTITGNHVTNACNHTSAANYAGIYLHGDVSNVTITGNVSQDNGSATIANTAGIGCDTHSAGTSPSDIIVTGNRCFDTRAPKYQEWGIRLGHSASATTQPQNWTISNNDLRDNLTLGLKNYSTASDDHHNIGPNKGAMPAKGTGWISNATDLRDLAPGADDTVLTVDSSTALGLKWATSGGGPITKVLAADVSITSQPTLQNITGLGVTIGTSATEIWLVKYWLLVNGANSTMDVKFGYTYPTACTIKWGYLSGGGQSSYGGWGQVATGTSPLAMATELGAPAAMGTVAGGGIQGIPIIAVIFGGATAGTAQLQFAQNTSDAAALKILKGSAAEIIPLQS